MKTCAICHSDKNPDDAKTCSGCGEGTWKHPEPDVPTVRRPLVEDETGGLDPFPPNPGARGGSRAARPQPGKRSPS